MIKALWELEREAIVDALTELGGDIDKAARALEIGRMSLYRKIHGYEIDVESLRPPFYPRSRMKRKENK